MCACARAPAQRTKTLFNLGENRGLRMWGVIPIHPPVETCYKFAFALVLHAVCVSHLTVRFKYAAADVNARGLYSGFILFQPKSEKNPKNALKCGFWSGSFFKVHAGARLFRGKKKTLLRPRARLGASTEITKKNRQGHRAAENITPFCHF